MTARSFCTITASTKRNVSLGGGRTGAAVTYLASLLVTPLWPVSADTVRSEGLNSPREYKECYHVPSGVTLPDVLEGDVLVHGGSSYPIFSAAEWTDGSVPCLRIVVQQIKGS